MNLPCGFPLFASASISIPAPETNGLFPQLVDRFRKNKKPPILGRFHYDVKPLKNRIKY
jgi:hypothetical protein